jgi:hypothetical protein
MRRVEGELDGEDEGRRRRRRFLAAGGEDKGLATGVEEVGVGWEVDDDEEVVNPVGSNFGSWR